MNKKILRNTCLLLVIFAVAYFAVRLPFFSTGWEGGDGNGFDEIIFLNRIHKPNYFFSGRIHGVEMYGPPMGHPAPPYEMFGRLGEMFQVFNGYRGLGNHEIIFRLKAITAANQFIIFFVLLLFTFRKSDTMSLRKRIFLYFLLFGAATVPQAIKNSNEFQLDSFFGLSMAGYYCLVLTAAALKTAPARVTLPLLFVSAAFLGLGKNEWSLSLALSMVACLAYLAVRRLLFKVRGGYGVPCLMAAASLAGCVSGNIASYLFEPDLYMSGWRLLESMVHRFSIFGAATAMGVIRDTYHRYIFLAPLLVMGAYSSIHVARRLKEIDIAILMSYSLSMALFLGFLLQTWGDTRYFAPAFISLVVTCTAIYIKYQRLIKGTAAMATAATLLVLFCQSVYYATSPSTVYLYNYGTRDISHLITDKSCVNLLPVEDAYDENIDFIHWQVGYDAAVRIASKYGAEMCPTGQ